VLRLLIFEEEKAILVRKLLKESVGLLNLHLRVALCCVEDFKTVSLGSRDILY